MECHVPTFPFSFYVGKTIPPNSYLLWSFFNVRCGLKSCLKTGVLGQSPKVVCFTLDFDLQVINLLTYFYSFLSSHQSLQENHPFLLVAEPHCLELTKSSQGSKVNDHGSVSAGETGIHLSSCSYCCAFHHL